MWLRQFLVPFSVGYHRVVPSINRQSTSTILFFIVKIHGLGLLNDGGYCFFFISIVLGPTQFITVYFDDKIFLRSPNKKAHLAAKKSVLKGGSEKNLSQNCGNEMDGTRRKTKSAHSFGHHFHWSDIIPESELIRQKKSRPVWVHMSIFLWSDNNTQTNSKHIDFNHFVLI